MTAVHLSMNSGRYPSDVRWGGRAGVVGWEKPVLGPPPALLVRAACERVCGVLASIHC